MINYKTSKEIGAMKECGLKLRKSVELLLPLVKPGMTTELIDKTAEKIIVSQGAETSFNKVKGYFWTTCVPINEQVVHTPPGKRVIKNGDVLTIDIGAYFGGFHTDYATTFIVGKQEDSKVSHFLDIGKETLTNAIKQAKVGNHLGHISHAIEEGICKNGYFVMRQLTGHGVGKELHEEPFVPGLLDKPIEKTLKIKPGLVLAIEVIYSMGTEEIAYEKGVDWSIITADKSLSACFEHTVAITDKNTFILT
ncbi:type I methionyl aminopeptidase [Candidatus Roizmanbacteria bacterium RIFOXYB2_FULL_38_10]|uniref:Methionine aminopeptidase n=1 Tax=Candidatus Roizmanbacteria bacterium RIFOXYD1_FULL_38_12 TaxID=1802093 RepID=A0A1F7KZU4_9BACT|nr:MAG: type I methionyl aminopeptidase [Candidatus Roizmanbacteria bacterium RIFOXYA2_FULL_38_14]OGK63406.1 MAG: type I methionyl aminopeptidase [Candidatus Roizmanbacteria bacterium RIFOXYA1_FULL_37_12]OGK65252.1 MAG: type I methionyl aminopeptidase [Candidatus Roizmanbacteria bacterium RIFOXYB1_FULL_40_23]OGK68805.1 MAG: type I methionyl aminopeptidase [Candidatus Roizmanbacteria bacterium RIFOXYB2_FULL_38_10]OGK69657.1 MAG: type I methionyl aminopeptidase [Candidatus Roizmanbacteria bacteri